MFLFKSYIALKTNMSFVIQQIVGEFEAVKRYSLFHPLGSTGRWVWVKVHSAGGYNISPSCHQPGGAMESIPDTDNCLTNTVCNI